VSPCTSPSSCDSHSVQRNYSGSDKGTNSVGNKYCGQEDTGNRHIRREVNIYNKAPMEITTAEHPLEKCYLDIVGPLPVTQDGNKYVLTFQDDLSKYVVAIPLVQQDAETVARAFVEKIVLTYGTRRILQTDRGANFVSEMFKNTCRILGQRKFNARRSTLNHKEVWNVVTVYWLSTSDTTWTRIRLTGISGSPSQPMCITLPSIPLPDLLPAVWSSLRPTVRAEGGS
jgi:hypothetical protein